MSNTRHARAGTSLRQERFASSPELQRGLMANLVVKRTSVLRDAEERKLIWAVQLLSHEEGGLQKLAEELLRLWPDRIASPTMQKIGTEPERIYTAAQVRVIREEIWEAWSTHSRESGDECDIKERFILAGEQTKAERLHERAERYERMFDDYIGDNPGEKRNGKSAPSPHPESYPARAFVEFCHDYIHQLPEYIERLCLDPEVELKDFQPHFFPTLVATLREYVQLWIAERTKGVVMTEIGRTISDACDYASDQRIMALINGHARIGKTFQAKIWCAQNPGSARYIQVPASNDEVGFYRAIARAIGVSINLNSKAHHLRDRIEDVLQSGQLTVVLDEAHFCWPTSNYRGALPRRISWICTALVNYDVPVVLVTTPQFFLARGGTVEKAHFNADQFDGRLMHYEALPDSLSKEDLAAVAKSLLPEGSDATITGLVSYAQASAKYLAGICAVVTRARYLAKREGRAKVQAGDVRKAMKEGVIPSDKALAAAVTKADQKTRPKRGARAVAYAAECEPDEALPPSRSKAAEPLHAHGSEHTFTGRERSVAATEAPPRRGTVPALAEA